MTAATRTDTERWLDLEHRRRQLEAELKTVTTDQNRLRIQILERWSVDGTSQEKADGYTVHLRRQLFPKVANRGALAVALKKEGLDDLLTVDDRAVGIWMSAHEDSGTPLPESVAVLVGPTFEWHGLAVRLSDGRDNRERSTTTSAKRG